ncbi:uncharacterized protein [Dysidea avara]|uniref:uncharacterized protein isoform X2 n=1 Tax=Dysidea avara TaxID=196820 RepID=UPI003318B67B
MAVANPPVEHTIFLDKFAELADTLKVGHVLRYLISDKVIDVDDSQRVNAAITDKDKAIKLLELLNGPIRAGNTDVLSSLVRTMTEHGDNAEKSLAECIKEHLQQCRTALVPRGSDANSDVPDLPARMVNEHFLSLLVQISSALYDPDGDLLKRFKLSLKFYHVSSKGVKIPENLYNSVNNIPDILDNLVNHKYVSVDNVELLEAVFKSSIATEDPQLYHRTQCIITEYRRVTCSISIPSVSFSTLPTQSQYVIVYTRHLAITRKQVEEIEECVFSALSLPKLYAHFCGYEGSSVKLCWTVHENLCDFVLEIPEYDHWMLLNRLCIYMIEIQSSSRQQSIDLQGINYVGCLLLPIDRSGNEWNASLLCVPAGHEEHALQEMINNGNIDPSVWEVDYIPFGFESCAEHDQPMLSLCAPDLTSYGWKLNTYEDYKISKSDIDGIAYMDIFKVTLPQLFIHGSCHNQYILLTRTVPVEQTTAIENLQTMMSSSEGVMYGERFQLEWRFIQQQTSFTASNQEDND